MAHYIQDSYGLHDAPDDSLKRGPLVASHPVEPELDPEAGPDAGAGAGYVSYNAYSPNMSTPSFQPSHKDMDHGGYDGNGNGNGLYGGGNYSHGTYTESEAPAPTPHPHPQSQQRVYNTVTPGADNFSESAAGGVAAIAYGVAERGGPPDSRLPPPPSQAYHPGGGGGGGGGMGMPRMAYPDQGNGGRYTPRDPNAGANPLGPPALHPPTSRSPSLHDDAHYQLYSNSPRNNNSSLGIVNPNEIMDDGDDGLDYSKPGLRDSILSGSGLGRGARGVGAGAAAAAAAAAAGSGAPGRQVQGNKAGGQMTEYDITTGQEKSPEWLAKKASKRKMWRWIIIIAVILVIAGAVVGGVVGGLVSGSKKGGKVVGPGGSGSAGGGGAGGGGGGGGNGKGLNINSPEIKALLNNKNLHKVFPGVDYTPLNTQYPDCLTNPPSQDDITKDLAVLSQLTNKVRLYGTDCKQTEMVLYAIQQLKMSDTIKVWLGVWQDNNATTNTRQLNQMWTILDTYGTDPFEGVIVANEALFRQQFTVTTLGSLLNQVRANMTANGYNIPVATSDLGDDWTAALAAESDLIMANVHPFFSGTPADKAAAWTYDFWTQHDGVFFKTDNARNIIAETGWPSGGGTDCGGPATCTDGAVAGIDEMNRFMEDWVCQALANGTNYFWFEAFDEPWKVSFNEPGKEWEDKWGLMDADRNLKKGVQIPDCGGKTV